VKLTKGARNVIIDQFENSPKKNKADLIEMIRPHYIPDYKKLVDQDLGRLANQIAASVRDENGARKIFAIEDNGKPALVNVDKTENIQDIRTVYKNLVKRRDDRDRSIGKVFKRGQEVAGQMSFENFN
jgi:hypothetical protein